MLLVFHRAAQRHAWVAVLLTALGVATAPIAMADAAPSVRFSTRYVAPAWASALAATDGDVWVAGVDPDGRLTAHAWSSGDASSRSFHVAEKAKNPHLVASGDALFLADEEAGLFSWSGKEWRSAPPPDAPSANGAAPAHVTAIAATAEGGGVLVATRRADAEHQVAAVDADGTWSAVDAPTIPRSDEALGELQIVRIANPSPGVVYVLATERVNPVDMYGTRERTRLLRWSGEGWSAVGVVAASTLMEQHHVVDWDVVGEDHVVVTNVGHEQGAVSGRCTVFSARGAGSPCAVGVSGVPQQVVVTSQGSVVVGTKRSSGARWPQRPDATFAVCGSTSGGCASVAGALASDAVLRLVRDGVSGSVWALTSRGPAGTVVQRG